MKRYFFLFTLLFVLQISSNAQQTCESAINQLNGYYNQVVSTYWQHYNWIASSVHPSYQPSYLNSLNYWYSQQTNYCNSTYYQITSTCSLQRPSGQGQDLSSLGQTRVAEGDKRKRVQLEIPDNPQGWQH